MIYDINDLIVNSITIVIHRFKDHYASIYSNELESERGAGRGKIEGFFYERRYEVERSGNM